MCVCVCDWTSCYSCSLILPCADETLVMSHTKLENTDPHKDVHPRPEEDVWTREIVVKNTHTHTRSLIPTHRCCDRLTFAGSKYQRPLRPLVTSPEFTVHIWKAKRRREGKYRRGGKEVERKAMFKSIKRPKITQKCARWIIWPTLAQEQGAKERMNT